jgi:hypothetical protein
MCQCGGGAEENASMIDPAAPLDGLRYGREALGAIATRPYEGLERVRERLAENAESRRRSWRYVCTPDGERRLHELLGVPWRCNALSEFEDLWPANIGRLRRLNLKVGRGAFGGWDDADSGLGRVVWCVARHLQPQAVVETGVARGLTSSLVLEALARNGSGRLYSIDLPPLIDTELSHETGCAVEPHQRERWTLLKGSSRRLLSGLVAGLPGIELFVHDSMHTTRNVRFELDVVWPALVPGGVAVVDDVERSRGFAAFTRAHPDAPAVVLTADDGRALFGCVMKPRRADRAP